MLAAFAWERWYSYNVGAALTLENSAKRAVADCSKKVVPSIVTIGNLVPGVLVNIEEENPTRQIFGDQRPFTFVSSCTEEILACRFI